MEKKDRRDYKRLSELAKQFGLHRYWITDNFYADFQNDQITPEINFGALTLQPNVWKSCGIQ